MKFWPQVTFKNFVKFRGKYLSRVPFLNKVESLKPSTLLWKRLWHRCFPVNSDIHFYRTPPVAASGSPLRTFHEKYSRKFVQMSYSKHLLTTNSYCFTDYKTWFPEDLWIIFELLNTQNQPPIGVLKKRCSEICNKFTGEHPCRSVISIKQLLLTTVVF